MINFNCRHYKGSRPCSFNKQNGSECPSCSHVSRYHDRILFVKLDAIGDVLRSASLLPFIIARHDSPYIAWLTRVESVELVKMMTHVDEVIQLSDEGLLRAATGGWDYVYSLSNDLTSASIASAARANHPPIGFSVERGIIKPSNDAARTWLEMAAFDRLKRANTASYQTLMLRIMGFEGAVVPRPSLEISALSRAGAVKRIGRLFPESSRRKVAINVGSGARWPKKMLSVEQICQFIRQLLMSSDVDVLLVGGAAEIAKTQSIIDLFAGEPRVRSALTTESIPEFVALLTQVDLLLCGDTLALHIASALRLPTIAVFGPTSAAEIPDFDGLITKLEAANLDCLACYADCAKLHNCMSLLEIDQLVTLAVERVGARRG
jgi:ADP-heptose:LPS heptosyltransferase